MIVPVKDLKKLYDERKDDDTILEAHGMKFVPGYLKYLLMYAEQRKAETIHFKDKGDA